MASTDKELEAQLLEAGNQLLEPPSAVDDLLPLLDRIESYLSKVEQSPNKSMQAALLPSQKALVAERLFRHSDPDVQVSVASCISEITRITAPDAPYDDEQMKEVFQLIVSSFENLDDKSSPSYTKRLSILETVAKVRSCVVMLDLECDALIIEMFQHFLKAIRDYHSESVFSSMETIMTLVIEESEDISYELLSPLLASVKNDDEDVLPISRKLGERVIENSASKLKTHLEQEVETLGIALGDYSKVIASICEETAGDTEQNEVHDDGDMEDKLTIRGSSEEAVQAEKENSTAAVSSEQVDPVIDGSDKVIMNNGGAVTGEDESLADLNSLQKQEQGEDTEEVKSPDTSNVAEPDSMEIDKAVDTKQMPEEVSKDMDSLSTAQPAESPQADNEEETEDLLGQKIGSEDAPSPPREDPVVKEVVPLENEKGSDIDTSNALEKESTDVAPPSPSGSLPDESRPRRAGRHKKKNTSNKEATAVAEDESKKAIDETSDSDLKSSKRSGKKLSAGGPNENKSPTVVDAPKKESGAASDSEVKQKSAKRVSTGNNKDNTSVVVDAPKKESSSTSDSEARQKSAKKVDGNKISDESFLKQPEDKKKGTRSKVSSRRSSTKSSAMEVDKEIPLTPKSKPTKDELSLEETPKTNSKRKRLSEKEKQSGIKEFDDTEIIGSKIKVWWPKDHMYYKGVVDSFDSGKKKHVVKYNDGDEEILNLKKQKWLYVESDSESEEEQEGYVSSHDGSSELPLKKKARTDRDGSTKKEKTEASPKLGASSSKSKGRTTKSGRKSDGRSKGDTSKAVGKTDDDRFGKLKDQTPRSKGKSVDVAQKASSKSKNNDSQTPKSSKSKEDDSSIQRASTKSKQDTLKAGKSMPKTVASTPKGKSPQSSSKANGKVKSGSKARDTEDMEEDSTDSEKAPERSKGKSVASSKAQGTKSGKKRRRGARS
ncbi:sister chromatid cohesion protein PDS5 homolog C isoform X2 [Argentina anserina]|uniref:sister chromatid cohesion protein PDS5 homolog C isoform X2 n=1 Tax=Argentina anserina TaxID=57926 RepID=UPI0021763E49|nr:sister chromatid cohesion protein PDS5 homolog C isoform X2 [Potentilla anserina]